MRYVLSIAVASLITGFAVAKWMQPGTTTAASSTAGSAVTFDRALPVDERLEILEEAVSEERYARQLLQDELAYVYAELDSMRSNNREVTGPDIDIDRDSLMRAQRVSMAGRNSAERRAERLSAAGFADDQAAWIVRRESELQMESLQARYDAERDGRWQDYEQGERVRAAALKEELGDASYEKYLGATGQSTAVAIGAVLESSPAQRAGLRPGDEIIRYGGERIYSISDLNRATREGQPGESVVVEFDRDGAVLQVPLTRGPVGIIGAGRSRR
jgi:S1-C subfamily serine protease